MIVCVGEFKGTIILKGHYIIICVFINFQTTHTTFKLPGLTLKHSRNAQQYCDQIEGHKSDMCETAINQNHMITL